MYHIILILIIISRTSAHHIVRKGYARTLMISLVELDMIWLRFPNSESLFFSKKLEASYVTVPAKWTITNSLKIVQINDQHRLHDAYVEYCCRIYPNKVTHRRRNNCSFNLAIGGLKTRKVFVIFETSRQLV